MEQRSKGNPLHNEKSVDTKDTKIKQYDKIEAKHINCINRCVNVLNSPIERKGFSDWLIKQNPTLCRIQDTPKTKRFKRVKNKRMEKDIPGKHEKKTGGHNLGI